MRALGRPRFAGTGPTDQTIGALRGRRVYGPVVGRIEPQRQDLEAGTAVQLILTGVQYFGLPDTFEAKSEWGSPHHHEERDRFVEVINDVSDPRGTLRRTVPSSHQFGFVGQGGTRRTIDRPQEPVGRPWPP